MLITTGKVNNGVIVIEGKDLPEGATVTLIAHEGDETFELDASQENELLAAIAEIERGEFVAASELLDKIRHS
jgi:hypothetical protein